MPRPKVNRQEEERIFQENRRARIADNQRRRRQAVRNANTDESRNNNTSINERNQFIVQDHLGSMDILCIHWNAKHFVSENFSNKGLYFHDCCSHGSVILEPTATFPKDLLDLFNGSHAKSNVFFQYIRIYNNSLSFASFNANLVNFQSRRSGP